MSDTISSKSVLAPDANVPVENLEALGRLASKLGHDFNNILASIQGCMEIMRNRLDADYKGKNPCDRQLKIIESSVRKGIELTTKIRAFMRPGPIPLEPIQIAPVIVTVADIISQSGIMRDDIEVISRANPVVRANEFLVTQVLTGICLNAIEAMAGHKERTLLIFIDEETIPEGDDELAAGTYALVSVIDHGSGMSQEVRAHVFEPFFSTKKNKVGDGYGLNLVMADGILRKHGGAMRIGSERDRGTAVHIYLPVG